MTIWSKHLDQIASAYGLEFQEVVHGTASRINRTPCLLMGSLAIPQLFSERPDEIEILVENEDSREAVTSALRGIFRVLPDGCMLFHDGGVEMKLRLLIYTARDIGLPEEVFHAWWSGAEQVMPGFPCLRLFSAAELLTFALLRDEVEDRETARLLVKKGTVLPDADLPPRLFAVAAEIYAEMFNDIASNLEELEEEL